MVKTSNESRAIREEVFQVFTAPRVQVLIDKAMEIRPLSAAECDLFAAHLQRVSARETCLVCDRDHWALSLQSSWLLRTCQCCGYTQCFVSTPFTTERSSSPVFDTLSERIRREIADVIQQTLDHGM